jgi:tRNA dimethylallyltransferase
MRFAPEILKACWFLAGPTACGKTETGLLLAEHIGGEILSLDSMALYVGMDIGTAKASPEEQARIPHHLIDVIAPHEEYSVAEYLREAEQCCRDILVRGRVPLFVGGTGLFLRSILRGVFEGPSADWELRRRLEEQAKTHEPCWLHDRLREVDPASAEKLHPNDMRRVIRALEVFELTGRPLSEQHQHHPLPTAEQPQHVDWLFPPRDWLYRRIDERVDTMIERGLAEEVRGLLSAEKPLSHTARQALGYKELFDAIEGEVDLDAAIECVKTRTRQFAKRQHTWFRNLVECHPVEITGQETPQQLVDRILNNTREAESAEP